MDQPQADARDALLAELHGLQREMETTTAPAFIEPVLSTRLTMQQLKVLAILALTHTGVGMQSVATSLGVSLATLSGIVDRLEAADMVARTQDPRDQRVRLLIPTDAGRDVMKQLANTQPQVNEAVLARLTIDELRALTRGVAGLVRVTRELAAEGTNQAPAGTAG
ncbi:MarR family winged helix-turn-helix transcriptional regulator [Microbacterium rhizophilus]|uniref:MarR family winged helix-turn-helix transcriptional regulator n=1 Tax=Microbacterium rhizophilus TaxID=3138934 RepID=UPI0031E5EE3E